MRQATEGIKQIAGGVDEQGGKPDQVAVAVEYVDEAAPGTHLLAVLRAILQGIGDEEVADDIIVMGKGGLITFSGTPTQLREFFSIQQLGDVFECIDWVGSETWHQRFEAMSGLQAIVRAREAGFGRRGPA